MEEGIIKEIDQEVQEGQRRMGPDIFHFLKTSR